MTSNPNVAFVEVTPAEQAYFSAHVPGAWQTRYLAEPLTQVLAELKACEVLAVFVHSRVDAAALSQLPRLRLIVTRSTGFDHIDLAVCRARGVAVCHVPDYGVATVAEFAFTLLLAVARKLGAAARALSAGAVDIDALRGVELAGKTFGVIGTGRIGRHAAHIARGFALNVIAYDPAPDATWARAAGVRYVTRDELLGGSDVISLHCPGTPQTRHLLNGAAFARMKRGVIVINTARGDVIDAAALLAALESGQVAGAGLDVLEDEGCLRFPPCPTDSAAVRCNAQLLRRPDVVVTPHIAFNTGEALARLMATSLENIAAFLAGRPQHRID